MSRSRVSPIWKEDAPRKKQPSKSRGRQLSSERRLADPERIGLLDAPWAADLNHVQDDLDYDLRVMRDQVYSLSKALGEAQSALNRDVALRRLRDWVETPDKSARAVIERELTYQGTILVTDMSGFTRITREEGILHFLMLIKQMQSICLPILARFGGTILKVEADDLFVLFPTPGLAVQAAAACMAATEAFSATRTRKNDQIVLSIGMIDGPMWLIPHVDAFGETLEVGFRLGEDTADKKEILVHSSVKRKIEANGSLPADGYEFVRAPSVEIEGATHEVWTVKVKDDKHHDDVVENVFARPPRRRRRPLLSLLGCCCCCCCYLTSRLCRGLASCVRGRRPGERATGSPGAASRMSGRAVESFGGSSASFGGVAVGVTAAASRASIISAEVNQEEPIDLITMLNERINTDDAATMKAIDQRIIRRFQRQGVSVLVIMLQLHTSGVGRSDELKMVHTVLEIKALGKRVISRHNGNTVKAVQDRTVPALFALMPSATAALESLVLIAKLCEQQIGKSFGMRAGIASGEVLDFDGCNTFGDPVNTAFKLGEDLAGRWEVAVDPTAAKELPTELLKALPFKVKSAEISSLNLRYHSLQMDGDDVQSVLAQVELVGNSANGFGGGAVGSLDWTPLVGKGVSGLQIPYGKGQEKAANVLQAHSRGWIQRAKLNSKAAFDQSLDVRPKTLRKNSSETATWARKLWQQSVVKVIITLEMSQVRSSRTMQQLRKMSVVEPVKWTADD